MNSAHLWIVQVRMPEPASAHQPYYGQAEPPSVAELQALKEAAAHCKACHLWLCGTQTVFGDGPREARIMMIGEQPGDKEDLQGKPFVGPAGAMLDKAMVDAGLTREEIYLTNAVKHFKWEQSAAGNKRIHGKPNKKEVQACNPWLQAELKIVQPECIVLLGATAAQSMLGPNFRLTQHRGEFLPSLVARLVLATLHPSAILRADDMSRRQAYEGLVRDFVLVREALAHTAPAARHL